MKKIYSKNFINKMVNRVSYIEYYNINVEPHQHSFCLYWFTDYIPGHPDGEYKFHYRAQGFRCDPRKHGFNIPEKIGVYNNKNEKVKDYYINQTGRIVFL